MHAKLIIVVIQLCSYINVMWAFVCFMIYPGIFCETILLAFP